MTKEQKKIEQAFLKSSNILVLLHQCPDGDTIASSLALKEFLVASGKEVQLAVNGEVPDVFHFLPGVDEITNDFLFGDFDLIIAVDCGDVKRTGFPSRLAESCSNKKPLINIDHHTKNDLHKIAKINLIDEKAAAAAEIVFDLIVALNGAITPRIATYVLSGIYFDTGGFQHSNLTEKTLQIASQCLSCGGRMGLVSSRMSYSKSSSALRLWGMALSKMELNSDGIAVSYLSLDDVASVGARPDDSSGVVNLMNSVPSARVAILFVESSDGTIKASLRTESSHIDVAKLARVFGGGGHKKASGFTLEGELAELFRRMFVN